LPAPLPEWGLWATIMVVALCHVVALGERWRKLEVGLPAPALGLGYAVVLCLALALAPDVGKAFIYFQF
jgi:alginate O-acetyltransferase complex protein AlgI